MPVIRAALTSSCVIGLLAVSALDSRAQLPVPILYLDFEDEGNELVDKSPSGNDAVIDGSVNLVDGAPAGWTPDGGVLFSGGHLDISGIDVPSQLAHRDSNPDGSYTFTAWIKPQGSSLGQGFYWGQTQQGLHLGLRNGGVLHSAHWGADWNAATVLAEGVWVHTAFVYDGPNDTGTIYLDGQVDGSSDQIAPNGGGTLMLGARNNGENPIPFDGFVDEAVVWDEVLTANQIMVLAEGGNPLAGLGDTDGDGMPDLYEDANGLDRDVDDRDGDLDGDRLTNFEEFTQRTDPQSDDTDGDGLKDNVETNTGNWVSRVDTGTDPRNPDSDDDGLPDEAETNTGTLVDENDTGTDPNNPDTDGDNHLDGAEIDAGFDPNDPADGPGIPEPLLYYTFEENGGLILEDQTGNDLNGTIERGMTFVEGAPDGPTPAGGARFLDGLVQVSDLDVPSDLAHRNSNPDGSYTFACWMKPDTGAIGGRHFFWGQTVQGIHHGLHGNGNLRTAHWGSDFSGGAILTANEWVHAVWTYDGRTDTGSIYLNGVLDGGPFNQIAPNGSGNLILGARSGGSENFNGCIDEVAVWQDVLPVDFIVALAGGAPVISPEDTDGDGMSDRFEDRFGLNKNDPSDAGLDGDQDGLTNLEEFEQGTDPTAEDTDGDGLLDGVETNTGTFVSADDTGTSPIIDDGDRDGLLDGQEVVLGTDPLDPDTDGDGFLDGSELELGSNPLRPDAPSIPPPYLYYNFEEGGGDTLIDLSGNDFDGTIERGVTFVEGAPAGPTPDGGGRFQGGLVQVFGIDVPTQLAHRDSLPDGSYTFACWMKPDAGAIGGRHFFWGQTSEGIHHGLYGNGTLRTAHWGSDFSGATILTPDEWVHAAWTYDGPRDTARLYLNGVQDGGPFTQVGPNGSGNLILGGRSGGAEHLNGCIDEVTVWREVLNPGHVAALAAGGSPFKAPRFFLNVVNNGPDQLDLIWESRDGLTYTVRSETDPSSGLTEDWPIYDGHENLAATPPFNTLTIDRPVDPVRLFAVESGPAPPVVIFGDDFESGQGDWTTGSDGADGTAWELGNPTTGPTVANSPANCFATNLNDDYGLNADVWLRSPAIDLTTAGAATLWFSEFRDIEAGFDTGSIRVLDASDDSEIAIIDGIDRITVFWEQVKESLPAEALGNIIKIEFRFQSDEVQNFAGWYIDDFQVTVP